MILEKFISIYWNFSNLNMNLCKFYGAGICKTMKMWWHFLNIYLHFDMDLEHMDQRL
jgi:hypothetical protein